MRYATIAATSRADVPSSYDEGTSSGFGHALVQHILDGGDMVAATSRNPSNLSFEHVTRENYLPVELDLGSAESVQIALNATLRKFGRIDVVV